MKAIDDLLKLKAIHIKKEKKIQCPKCRKINPDFFVHNNRLCDKCYEINLLEKLIKEINRVIETIKYGEVNLLNKKPRKITYVGCNHKGCKNKLINMHDPYCLTHMYLRLQKGEETDLYQKLLAKSDFFSSINTRYKNELETYKIFPIQNDFQESIFLFNYLFSLELFKLILTSKITYSVTEFLNCRSKYLFKKIINLEIDFDSGLIVPNKLIDKKIFSFVSIFSELELREKLDIENKISSITKLINYKDPAKKGRTNVVSALLDPKLLIDTLACIYLIEQAKITAKLDKRIYLPKMLFITDLLLIQLRYMSNSEHVGLIETVIKTLIKSKIFSLYIEITSCLIFKAFMNNTINKYLDELKGIINVNPVHMENFLFELNQAFAKSINIELDSESSCWKFYHRLFHRKLNLKNYDAKMKYFQTDTVERTIKDDKKIELNPTGEKEDLAPEYKRFLKLLVDLGINIKYSNIDLTWKIVTNNPLIIKRLIKIDLLRKTNAVITASNFDLHNNDIYDIFTSNNLIVDKDKL